jgi:hypothetical protein
MNDLDLGWIYMHTMLIYNVLACVAIERGGITKFVASVFPKSY